jgi:hypothetical protein
VSRGDRRGLLTGALVDLAVVACAVAVLGLVVGVLWPQLVTPALSQRTAEGISTDEVQLAKVFSTDGWFVVLGFAGSFLLGVVLMLRRRGHEVVVLLLVLAGTFLAARYVAQPIGISLGPPDPVRVLTDAKVGATAPQRLAVSSRADLLSWPLGAAMGALVVLLSAARLDRDRRSRASDRTDQVSGAGPDGAAGDGSPQEFGVEGPTVRTAD